MANPTLTGGVRRTLARLSLLAVLAGSALSATAGAAVLGRDDRNNADAFLPTQNRMFGGLGRIECLGAGSGGISFNATGWVIGSADTVITAAHSFFPRDRRGRSADVRDPAHCIFVLYNEDQSVREIANIRYAVSPWADQTKRGDGSFDFAVVKLAHRVRVSSIPAVSTAGGRDRPAAQLLAFQTGVTQDQRARITRGRTAAFPFAAGVEPTNGVRITDGSRLFSSSTNSSPGSSGGLYFDNVTGKAFGLHIGTLCDTSAGGVSYDPYRCFNYGLRFDRTMLASVDAVVRDAPSDDQLIPPDTRYPTAAAMLVALAEGQARS